MDWSTITPAVIAAAILAFGLEWFPWIAERWEPLEPAKKARIVAALVAVISAAAVLGQCYAWGDVCPENPWETFGGILLTFLLSGATSQGVHQLSRRELYAAQ